MDPLEFPDCIDFILDLSVFSAFVLSVIIFNTLLAIQ